MFKKEAYYKNKSKTKFKTFRIAEEKKEAEKKLEEERLKRESEIREVMKFQEILQTEKQVLEAKFARTQSKLANLKLKLKTEKSSKNSSPSSFQTTSLAESNTNKLAYRSENSDEIKRNTANGFFSPNKVN